MGPLWLLGRIAHLNGRIAHAMLLAFKLVTPF